MEEILGKYNKWQCNEIVPACTVLRGLVDGSKYMTGRGETECTEYPRGTLCGATWEKAHINAGYRRLIGFPKVLRQYLGLNHVPLFDILAAYNKKSSMEGK